MKVTINRPEPVKQPPDTYNLLDLSYEEIMLIRIGLSERSDICSMLGDNGTYGHEAADKLHDEIGKGIRCFSCGMLKGHCGRTCPCR